MITGRKYVFHVCCQTVGWYEEQCVQRVWCMLWSLNQALLSPADRLYINVIHQAAFTDMTSVVRRGLAGHNAHIKRLCSVRGIKGSAFLWSAVCFKATSPGKWWFDFKNKYFEKEYQTHLQWERALKIKIYPTMGLRYPGMSASYPHEPKLTQRHTRKWERQTQRQDWISWKEQQSGTFD